MGKRVSKIIFRGRYQARGSLTLSERESDFFLWSLLNVNINLDSLWTHLEEVSLGLQYKRILTSLSKSVEKLSTLEGWGRQEYWLLQMFIIRPRLFSTVPSAPPRNIRAKLLENDTLHLSWQPPRKEDHNGPLKGYKIFCIGLWNYFMQHLQEENVPMSCWK